MENETSPFCDHFLSVLNQLPCNVFIWCHGIKWRMCAILRLEVMFDERSEVCHRAKKPRVFLVFQICFVD